MFLISSIFNLLKITIESILFISSGFTFDLLLYNKKQDNSYSEINIIKNYLDSKIFEKIGIEIDLLNILESNDIESLINKKIDKKIHKEYIMRLFYEKLELELEEIIYRKIRLDYYIINQYLRKYINNEEDIEEMIKLICKGKAKVIRNLLNDAKPGATKFVNLKQMFDFINKNMEILYKKEEEINKKDKNFNLNLPIEFINKAKIELNI
jgi:hypothetical protein